MFQLDDRIHTSYFKISSAHLIILQDHINLFLNLNFSEKIFYNALGLKSTDIIWLEKRFFETHETGTH